MNGWTTLVCPRGAERELASHGSYGHVPYSAWDNTGKLLYVITVPDNVAPYFIGGPAGYWLAPDELQVSEPPIRPVFTYLVQG